MSTTRRVAIAFLTVSVLLALAACGSSTANSPAASKAKAAIAADIVKNQPEHSIGGGQGFSAAQVRCFTDRFVDAVGTDQLVKDGVITSAGAVSTSLTGDDQHLPQADANSLVSAIFGCTDNGASIVSTFKSQVSKSSFASAKKKCVLGRITPQLMQQALTDQYTGHNGSGTTALRTIASTCGLTS